MKILKGELSKAWPAEGASFKSSRPESVNGVSIATDWNSSSAQGTW